MLAAHPADPLVTFYDDASGERIELSARSLANWVAKTHFLLVDELGLGVGDAAVIALPLDWIAVPIALGCWSAGLRLTEAGADAAVAFVTPDRVAEAAGVPDVYAVNLASLTRSFGASAAPGDDYVTAVRPQADAWAAVRFPAGPGDLALDATTRAELSAQSATRASERGLAPGARVLFDRPWTGAADWIDALLAPMSVLGSVVLVAHADAAKREQRIAQEHITA